MIAVTPSANDKRVNLVLQGGGVLGIAEVGAIAGLRDAGYTFSTVTGTSVGSIVAAFVAAGVDNTTLKQLITELPYPKIMDKNSWLARIPIAGRVASWFWYGGSYKGDFLQNWIADALAKHAGVTTFGDLQKKIDAGTASPLGVVSFDVDRQLETVFPRDYAQFHLDPNAQTIASAIRASSSVLTFFQPAVIKDPVTGDTAALIDGGIVNNYAWDVASQSDLSSRTVGIRLESVTKYTPVQLKGFATGVRQLLAVLGGIGKARENRLMENSTVIENSICPATFGISEQAFNITPQQCDQLYASGYEAAKEWVALDSARIAAHQTSHPGTHKGDTAPLPRGVVEFESQLHGSQRGVA